MTPPTTEQPTRAQRRAERSACPKRRKRRRRTRQCGYGLLGLAFGLMGLGLILTRTPVAKRLLLPRLRDMTSTPITADRVYVGLDGSIVMEGATFYVPGMSRPTETPGPEARFFEVDRAVVWMDWGSLLSGMPIVETIELERPRFRLSHSKDTGRLNIAGLSFLMQDAGLGDVSDDFHLPVLSAAGGVIEIGEHDDAGYTALKEIPVEGDLVPVALPGGQTFGFRLRQVPDDRGRRGIDISGRYGADGLAITLDEFVLSDWSSEVVPTKVRDLYERLALSGAIGETTLRVSPAGKPSAEMSLEGVGVTLPFDLSGALTDTTSIRMEGTTGTIEVSADGVLARLSGTLDEVAYSVELDSDGVEPTSPFRCTLVTDTRLSTDMSLLFTAPDAVLEPIGLFVDPEADVVATVRLERPSAMDGAVAPIRKTGELRFTNGTAAYKNFPYRFENLEGVARFDDTTLSIDSIEGTHPNGARLSATGRFAPLGPESEVNLDVRVTGVPIDDELRAAMSSARRKMVDALFSPDRHAALVENGLVSTPGSPGEAPVFAFGGRADVDVRIHRELGLESVWTRTIDVRVPRAGLVPDHFPLPMIAEDVSININEQRAHLSGGVYRGLTGGTARVEAHVALSDEDGNPIRDPIPSVEIHASTIPLDERLRAAIPGYASSAPGTPGTLRDMLDRLGLEGEADCEALIAARPDGSLGYEVRASVDGLTSRPVPRVGDPIGPLVLKDVGGVIEVNEHVVGLDLAGMLTFDDADAGEPAPFRLDATIGYERNRPGFAPEAPEDGPAPPGPELDVLVSAEGLDLATPLRHAVSVFSPSWGDRVAGWRRAYQPEGRMSAAARFEGHVGGELSAEIELTDVERAAWGTGAERIDIGRSLGSIVLSTGPEPWVRARGVSAPVWYGRERVGTLRANGVLPLVRAGETPVRSGAWDGAMEVAIEGARFESSFTRRVVASRMDPGTRETIESRRPTGAYDLRLRLEPEGVADASAHEPGELVLPELGLTGSLGPRSLAFDHRGQRVELGELDGWLRFERTGGIIEDVSVDAGGWRARADGRWTVTDAGGRVEAALDVGSDAGVPEGLAAVLPEVINDTIGALAFDATGPVTARDVVLELEPDGDQWAYAASGVVVFENASLDTGAKLTELTGTMRFDASRDAGAARGDYAFEVDAERGRAAGVRFTDGRAEAHAGRRVGETMLPRIEAHVHGGRLAGSARVGTGEGTATYSADFVASGVRAAPVFDDLNVSPEPDEPAALSAMADPEDIERAHDDERQAWNNTADRSRGVIDGSLSVGGVSGDAGSRTGRGSVRVQGGRVLALPGIMQLIEFSNLQAPVGESLNSAQASFYIEGPVLTFEQVSVFSKSVEIFGYGTMRLPGQDLEMQFNSRSVNPIPVVSRLLEGLRDELITTRVRGTPGEMELTTEQLPGAKRIIRSIFGEPSPEEERLREVESRARQGQQRALRTAARAADREAMPAAEGTIVRDDGPESLGDEPGVPTLVIQPTDDE